MFSGSEIGYFGVSASPEMFQNGSDPGSRNVQIWGIGTSKGAYVVGISGGGVQNGKCYFGGPGMGF